tara:strand:- start:434 stop:646 length:213 start_codon:yes stop_codon:yes gene_type:complete
MYTQKKRSLNELRQTKDSFYVVPKVKKDLSLKSLLENYFSSNNEPIRADNIENFINHVSSSGYKFRITSC